MLPDEQGLLLGTFVRARRESLAPPADRGRRRRTPGLKREELAARAGIGITWVAWIEQGRPVRPSAETLARLASALELTRAERAYMFDLAGRLDPQHPFPRDHSGAPDSISAVVQALPWPAYGLDAAWNICCWNAAAQYLLAGLADEPDHRNLLRYVFSSDHARALLPDWENRAARVLAEFRADYGRSLIDPRARAVVEWLMTSSEPFARLWERQAVVEREGGERRFNHPHGGEMRFIQHTLRAVERPDFKLVTLQPG